MVNIVHGGETERFAARIATLEAQVRALTTQPILLNASTGQDGGLGITTDKNGIHVYNSSGVEVTRLQTVDGALICLDANNNEIARYGLLSHTAAGQYGAEVLVGGTWVQLGNQTTTWANVSGKPSTFPPSAHTHAGSDITSAVANATNATSAGHASDADGSSYAFNNNVGGTSYYAVWVGNDSGNHLGKNTSSIRYKTNVVSHYTDPANVLALTPVTYQRIAGGTTEYGLIDNVRYDLLSVALLSVVKSQDTRIKALETQVQQLAPSFTAPAPSPVAPQNTACNNPPATPPTPLPYTIQPQ